MRKFVTLLAATTLLASTVALAEDQVNSNDVLQTVPHQQNAEGLNVAENDAAAKPAADAQEQAAPEAAAKAPAKKHHKKHHVKHHHHHKAKPATTEAPAAAEPAQSADQPK